MLGNFGPDIVFYLRLSDPRIGLLRKGEKLDGDSFDKENLSYHLAIQEVYDDLARNNSPSNRVLPSPVFGHWITINADPPVKDVQRQIDDSICEYLKLR